MPDVMPALNQFDLVARDVDAAVAFYRLLGLDIPETAIWRTPTGAHHVDLRLPNGLTFHIDSPALAKEYNAGWRPQRGDGAQCVIGFSLPTRAAVDECHARMTSAGHPSVQPPYDAFWGARYAILQDPDGNHVGIMSPSDAARRRGPPSI
jgi:predicted enzyme related to lactoylglutathione lyase